MPNPRSKKKTQKIYYLRALRFMWKFLAPIYRPVWWLLMVLLLSVAMAMVEPNVYRLVIDAVTVSQGQQTVDFGYIFWLLLLWSMVSLLNLIFSAVYNLFFAYRLSRVDELYYQQAMQVFLDLDVAKHLAKKSGEILKKIDSANQAIWENAYAVVQNILPSWLTLVVMVIMGFMISWQMMLVTLLMVPFYLWIFLVGGRKTDTMQAKLTKKYEKFWGGAHDMATNIMAVKSFAREKFHLGKIIGGIAKIAKKQSKISLRWGVLSTAGNVMGVFSRLVIFCFGIYLISLKVVTLGTVVMFLSVSGAIYYPLQSLGMQLRLLQKQCGYLNSVEDLFNDANKIVEQTGAKELEVSKGQIDLKNVSFNYEKSGIIKNLTVSLKAGKMTALVGHSGAGKSTLASLLSRFYDVSGGQILIDGQDVRNVTLQSLRENIGLVMQDNTMFNETIYHNISYAKAGATRAEVEYAAKMANIHDFIVEQPQGYKTMVGERGLKLSGGQKQRIAIARVILKNPPILILDEATSALDSSSEKVVQEALEKVMKGRTSIVIAHRLSTVRRADQIVVLDKGRLVQNGTHSQLMKKKGIYRDLVDLQVEGLLAK